MFHSIREIDFLKEASVKKLTVILLLCGLGATLCMAAEEAVIATVTGQRVNLRAKADLQSEVVGQVSEGDSLRVKSILEEWLEVQPPEQIDLWVHRDFVVDGQVVGNNLNVRAGAGINYSVVGRLSRGEPVIIRGNFGEWVKISPPPRTSLWVSKSLVELPKPRVKTPLPPAPMITVETSAPPEHVSETVVTPPPAEVRTPPEPEGLKLIPLEGQGKSVKRAGELKPAPFVFGRPSPYRLVRRDGTRYVTLCYVRGNTGQLDSLVGENLVIHGREYWVQGVRQAVVVVESIERRARR